MGTPERGLINRGWRRVVGATKCIRLWQKREETASGDEAITLVHRPQSNATCTNDCGQGGFEMSKEMAYGKKPRHERIGVGGPDVVR